MKPEPIFKSSRRKSASASRRMSGSVSKSASRRVIVSEIDSTETALESVSDPTLRKRSARTADSLSTTSAPIPTSSAPLVETGSIAVSIVKEQNTGKIYLINAIQQNDLINAQGYAPTTDPLAVALRATMTATTARQPIVIPGAKKRRDLASVTNSSKSSHLSPILRNGIPLGAVVAFILFSLFSFSSLADGYTNVPLVGNAIQWVHKNPINWSLLIGDHAPIAQVGPTPTPQASDTGPLILPSSDYVAIARQAAASAGISQDYFVRQINQESGFNPYARSSAGAIGIAQFIPSTAAGLGINPYDPVASLYGAARYMARLSNSYGGDYAKALAAYNAGPPAVTRAVNSGGANWLAYTPTETQRYVHAIMG